MPDAWTRSGAREWCAAAPAAVLPRRGRSAPPHRAYLLAERPQSPVGKACSYALGQWVGLLLYLDHGVVDIDNNSMENALRPCALGKKNWLFIGDVKAGPRTAIFYSLIGSCLRHGLNPRAYLHWLFSRIAAEGTHAPQTLTSAAITKPEPVAAQAA
jgi:transposase